MSGGKYEGEVLAGRPHGRGKFLFPKVHAFSALFTALELTKQNLNAGPDPVPVMCRRMAAANSSCSMRVTGCRAAGRGQGPATT